MPNSEEQKLLQGCTSIKQVIESSMGWVDENVEEKYKTIYNLKKFRRAANRYEEAVMKRPSIAIFGQSQVGKSYLVSNLAKSPDDNSFEVIVRGKNETVDFIESMNPPGGGKEATGLVSRFTIRDSYQSGQQPFLLKLFTQSDLVKIIANGYLSDITHYQYEINRDEIQAKLIAISKKISPREHPGFDEDDVYELKEYLNHNFNSHFIVKDLNAMNFWDDIAAIVPYIKAEERADIFELLWGKREFFTEFFVMMSRGLEQIGFLKEVRCGLEALSPNSETILDVQRLREMYVDDARKPSDVRLFNNSGPVGTLDRSIISALTAEAILPIPEKTAEKPMRTFLKEADILDFPGARSRNKIPEQTFMDNSSDKKLEVFLRGKVAFLFDRYNYNHEISTLLFCMDNTQPEVQDVPRLLYEWVKATHGGSPQKREERERILAGLVPQNDIEKLVPLLVVQTKFNIDLEGNPATDKVGVPSSHNWKWNARLDANFHQFMCRPLSDKWPETWSTSDGNFKNVFLLRDPKWSTSVYDGMEDGENESGVRPEYIKKLADMRDSFLSHGYVKKHFRNPTEAWEESTQPGKSGIDYIVKYLTPTCNPIIKREQVRSQIQELKQEIYNELREFYQGGSIEEKLKMARRNAGLVFLSLMQMQKKSNTFGNFIDKLVITDDLSWKIYFDLMMSKQIDINKSPDSDMSQASKTIPLDLIEMLRQFIDIDENEKADNILQKLKDYFGMEDEEALSEILVETGIDIRALLETRQDAEIPLQQHDRAYLFSGNLLDKWLEHLDFMKGEDNLTELGLSKKVADIIIRELNKSKNRVQLKRQIADITREHIENFQITGNIDIVARISANLINKFVNTLGWTMMPKAERPRVKKDDDYAIFSNPPVKSPEKKDLMLGVEFPGERFFVEWATGIRNTFEANVYFEEKVKDAEKAEADAKLGAILEKVK